ncbi:RNaseH domain-containing protein [Streptomyces achromogenes]|uniref:RNaseH domain-containing protein n=2 Tax=Streptomyces achromogenes TaxID=67255 RepID=UPI0037159F23
MLLTIADFDVCPCRAKTVISAGSPGAARSHCCLGPLGRISGRHGRGPLPRPPLGGRRRPHRPTLLLADLGNLRQCWPRLRNGSLVRDMLGFGTDRDQRRCSLAAAGRARWRRGQVTSRACCGPARARRESGRPRCLPGPSLLRTRNAGL